MVPQYVGFFTLSAAVLLLEVGLTRILAITQWYHFAFLVVSLALLGFGAGGSLHMAVPRLGRLPRRGLLAGLGVVFTTSCVGILLVNHFLPLDLYILAWDGRQFLYLAVQYIVLVLPFLVAGLAVSLLFEAHPGRVGTLYACNLAGSALGTLLAPPLLGLLGAGRLPLAAGLLALAASALFLLGQRSPHRAAARTWTGVSLALVVVLSGLVVRPPEVLSLRLDPHKNLVQQLLFPGSEQVYSRENAFSRVDVVSGGPHHSFPGLTLAPQSRLPAQMTLVIDGGQPSPLTLFDPLRTDTAFLDEMLTALPYRAQAPGRVLLVEPVGGLDLLQALQQGAREVVVLEENPLVTEVVTERFAEQIGHIFQEGSVQLKRTGARSYLVGQGDAFDLIVFSLTGERAVVTAGAYSLVEEDLLTVEGVRDALRRLNGDGMLAVMRWIQQPPSEGLRAFTTLVTALEEEGIADPGANLLAVRSWSSILLLARPAAWSSAEIARVRQFCRERRFDLVWLPGMAPEEANLYNRMLEGPIYHDAFRGFLEADDRAVFFREWPSDVRPARDERPFFFHFSRWGQLPELLRHYGQTVQPFGGAGFVVLPALLVLAGLASVTLIVLPAAVSRRRVRVTGWGSVLLYFAALGCGYMGVEIPLLGRFTLLLDQPLYATATVLFTLLVGSGLGSLLGERRPSWLRPAFGGLLALATIYALGWAPVRALLGLPLFGRLVVGAALLLPLGFLMGVPFPAGMRLLGEGRKALIPWAWAVNGCASVLGAVGAQMGALSCGYGYVLLAGVACYGVAWLASFTLRSGASSAEF